jgi:haloacetate dehalogenase
LHTGVTLPQCCRNPFKNGALVGSNAVFETVALRGFLPFLGDKLNRGICEMAIVGFKQQFVLVNGVRISVHVGGKGAPLLLLHGFPQNHLTWETVAPSLSEGRTCVVADLRGYGDSDAPESWDGALYTKRLMATDMVGVMAKLGYQRFDVLGHDRGARVAYRMALDFPDVVTRLGIIEIVPTVAMWAAFNAEMALAAYHWTHLAQPYPLPERMIAGDPLLYVDHKLKSWTLAKSLDCFSAAALASYRAQMADPARVHAMCADYRAGATLDRQYDAADLQAGRKIICPLRFIYAKSGFPARSGDPMGYWRQWSDAVQGVEIDSGHFAMEENPIAVLEALAGFFD